MDNVVSINQEPIDDNINTVDIKSQLTQVASMVGLDIPELKEDNKLIDLNTTIKNDDSTQEALKSELMTKLVNSIQSGKTSDEIVNDLLSMFPGGAPEDMKAMLKPMVDKSIEEFNITKQNTQQATQKKAEEILFKVINGTMNVDDGINELVKDIVDETQKEKAKKDLYNMFMEAKNSTENISSETKTSIPSINSVPNSLEQLDPDYTIENENLDKNIVNNNFELLINHKFFIWNDLKLLFNNIEDTTKKYISDEKREYIYVKIMEKIIDKIF